MGTRDGRSHSLNTTLPPGRIDSDVVYEGRVVRLSVDLVRFPDGSEGSLEMIRRVGCVALPGRFVGSRSRHPVGSTVPVRLGRLSVRGPSRPAGGARGELGGMCTPGTGRRNRNACGNHDPAHAHLYYTRFYGRGDQALRRHRSGAGGTLERPGRVHGSSKSLFFGGAGNGPGRTDCGRQEHHHHPFYGPVRARRCVPPLRSIVPKVGRWGSRRVGNWVILDATDWHGTCDTQKRRVLPDEVGYGMRQ